jgi:arabinogalactan endo-1,4-beta-galactosidase
MSLDAQALGERLASDWAYQNKGYDWHNRLSGQLRTEVLSQMESMRKSGVTVISVPFGTRMTHRFVWTGRGGEGTHIKPTYSFLMSAAKFKKVRETVSDLIDPATWSFTGGRRKGVKSVRVWVEDDSAATMFKLAN